MIETIHQGTKLPDLHFEKNHPVKNICERSEGVAICGSGGTRLEVMAISWVN